MKKWRNIHIKRQILFMQTYTQKNIYETQVIGLESERFKKSLNN